MIHDILQTKERMIRKQYHSRSNTEIGLIPDVRAFSSSNQRSEFPNKFKVKATELDNLENVITNLTAPKLGIPQSSKVRLLSQAVLPRDRASATPQAFYYSDRNEILGFDQFFKVHKALAYRRKNFEKLHAEEQTEEKRIKLKDLTLMSAHTRARSKDSNPQTSLIISPSPTRPSYDRTSLSGARPWSAAKTTTSGSGRENSPFALKLCFVKDHTMTEGGEGTTNDETSQRVSIGSKFEKSNALPNEINVETNYLVSYEGRESCSTQKDISALKDPSQDPMLTLPHQDLSQNELQNRSSGGEAGFYKFTEPKLTRKHVFKHLIHYIVTPKKLKRESKSIEFEKYYTRVYKDPKAMDKEVETNLQRLKTRNQLRNIETLGVSNTSESPVRLRAVSRSRDRAVRLSYENVGKSMSTLQTMESMVLTTKEQDQEKHAELAGKISQSIQDITEVLADNNITMKKEKNKEVGLKSKSQKRPLSGEPGSGLLKQLLANRIPSRKVITEKYHIPTLIQRNTGLRNRALQIKAEVLKKAEEERTVVSYSTADHVEYYIS